MELLKLYDEKLLNKIRTSLDDKNHSWDETSKEVVAHIHAVLPTLDKSKLPMGNLLGHELTFFTYWHKFVQGKKLQEQELKYIVNVFDDNISQAAIFMGKRDAFQAAQTRFKLPTMYCRKTGKMLYISLNNNLDFEFKQWNRTPGKENEHSGSFGPLLKNKFADKIEERIIDCPSGNLLINDWFRCENNEFSEAVKEKKEDYSEENSINYPSGRVKSINRYADLGFAHVNMTDSPSIYVEGNKIIFGRDTTFDWEKFDDEKGNNKHYQGRICLDMWTASCIDEDVLVNILMTKGKGMTKAKATSHLKKLKKVWTAISIKVKPGKYKLSFCGDFKNFDRKIRKKGSKVNKKYKMFCLMEKV